jgi:hypothetical protein
MPFTLLSLLNHLHFSICKKVGVDEEKKSERSQLLVVTSYSKLQQLELHPAQ